MKGFKIFNKSLNQINRMLKNISIMLTKFLNLAVDKILTQEKKNSKMR